MPPPKLKTTRNKYEPAVFHNRKEDYDILTEVKEIQEQRKQFKIDEVEQMHTEFAKDNPELFKKCYNDDMTDDKIEELVYMIELRKKVKNNEISFEQASAQVSAYFAQKYQPELLTKDMKRK